MKIDEKVTYVLSKVQISFQPYFEEPLMNVKPEGTSKSRDRCYDHNFLQFSTIFGEKIGVFLKNQCYDQIFA
jgi:hypothetical protein